jgi:hypothetical protein
MMECESTVAVNAFTLSAVTEVWSSCPRPGRAQKGLHQHTPIGPLLAPDNPSAFACAAPWRQQRSREPLRQQRGPQRAQTFDSNGPGVRIRASAAPCIRDSSARSPLARGRRRPVAESPPRISTRTPSTISASTTPAARAISRGRRHARTRQPTPRWTHPMPCVARFRSTAPNAGATRTRRRVDNPTSTAPSSSKPPCRQGREAPRQRRREIRPSTAP